MTLDSEHASHARRGDQARRQALSPITGRSVQSEDTGGRDRLQPPAAARDAVAHHPAGSSPSSASSPSIAASTLTSSPCRTSIRTLPAKAASPARALSCRRPSRLLSRADRRKCGAQPRPSRRFLARCALVTTSSSSRTFPIRYEVEMSRHIVGREATGSSCRISSIRRTAFRCSGAGRCTTTAPLGSFPSPGSPPRSWAGTTWSDPGADLAARADFQPVRRADTCR